MATKKLLLPRGEDYPIELTSVFVWTGAFVSKGDKLYTMKAPSGREVLVRAPMDGVVTGHVWNVGDKLSARQQLLGIDPVAAVRPEVTENTFEKAFDEKDDIRDAQPSPAPKKPAAKPRRAKRSTATPVDKKTKAEAVKQTTTSARFVTLLRVIVAGMLFLPLTYVALHVAHSVPFPILADSLLFLALMLPLPWIVAYPAGLLWVLMLPVAFVFIIVDFAFGNAKGGRYAFLLGAAIVAVSFFMPLNTLKAYSTPQLSELVGHLTGGPVLLYDEKLYVLGRQVNIPQQPKIERVWRLGPYGAVIEKSFILTDQGQSLDPAKIISDAQLNADGKLSYRCAKFNLDSIISRRSDTQRYADHAIFYSPDPSAKDPSYTGTEFFINSTGQVVRRRETKRSLGSLKSSCDSADDAFRVPEY
ncbi:MULTISPECIES: hypothetical protein [Alphaproteobacteria]|uniref:hypothetical protein n=1 Tax=Alphaproteobacteria TaxID=28211 RepID=UPI0032643C53